MLLTEKISLKSERLCYSRDFIAELREKIYDLLFIRELGIIRARVWISALLWVVYFKGSSWTIISTGFWERIMLCSVIRKQHYRSIRFHLKFFHVFSKSRLPALLLLLKEVESSRSQNDKTSNFWYLVSATTACCLNDEGFHGFRQNDAGSRARTCSQGFLFKPWGRGRWNLFSSSLLRGFFTHSLRNQERMSSFSLFET